MLPTKALIVFLGIIQSSASSSTIIQQTDAVGSAQWTIDVTLNQIFLEQVRHRLRVAWNEPGFPQPNRMTSIQIFDSDTALRLVVDRNDSVPIDGDLGRRNNWIAVRTREESSNEHDVEDSRPDDTIEYFLHSGNTQDFIARYDRNGAPVWKTKVTQASLAGPLALKFGRQVFLFVLRHCYECNT